MKTLATALLGLAVSLAAAAPDARAAEEAEPVAFVVLLENGVGATRAQGYLDQLLGEVGRLSGWPRVSGEYTTRKRRAEQYIADNKPQFGLFSLGAYLALEGTHNLRVVGEAHASGAGGRRYFLVAKGGDGLDACKGKALASNHLDDKRFVDNVILGGAARLADFTLDPTRRPVQTLKRVIRDEAACALIDDAQFATMKSVQGGDALKAVWSSAELPPMPIVAFPDTTADRAEQLKRSLPRVCDGDDKSVCSNIGVEALEPADDARFADLVRAYRGKEIAHP